ncbi:class I adenylate-forming enzyme family protein [Microtetraspora niveoalba]|uniref:class I adenylate-forming enzyme family protein n=1 Tax=Microtetraspora niveoalba TaxID=46175 RepID=UPI000AF13509|nr:AMP-binding protein [Microtetraspora niveoalba]
MTEHQNWPVHTIDMAVREHARTRPDALAVVSPRLSLTWRELDEAADRCAGHLAGHGVGPGARVGWLGGNDAAFPAVLLATWRRRASLVGLNWRLPDAGQRAAIEAVGLTHLVSGPGLAERGAAIASGLAAHSAVGERLWPDDAPGEVLEPEPGDEAIVFFTSGSTGVPKAVPLTRIANELGVANRTVHRFGPESRQLIVPPVFHLAGATWVQYGLRYGTTQVYIAEAGPAAITAAFAEHGITHAVLVPTLIRAVVDHLKEHPRKLPELRHIAYGAAPITMSLLKEAIDVLGCELCQIYGMTEAGSPVTCLPPEDHRPDPEHAGRLSSAGRLTAGVEVSVREPGGGAEVPPGASGELHFRSPFMMRGYIGGGDATREVLVGGWLNTRDVGHVDADGYVYVEGRSDHMIVTGGMNVHPGEVENVIDQMPEVLECAVYGAADELWGRRVCAVVVCRDDGLTEQAVKDHCRRHLPGYKVPKTVRFLSALPRTATGKVVRAKLDDGAGEAGA